MARPSIRPRAGSAGPAHGRGPAPSVPTDTTRPGCRCAGADTGWSRRRAGWASLQPTFRRRGVSENGMGSTKSEPLIGIPSKPTVVRCTESDCQLPRTPAIESVLKKLDPDDREVASRGAGAGREDRGRASLPGRPRFAHGLLDRRRFRSELDQYVSFSARYGGPGRPDHRRHRRAQAVNDSLGHHAGDNLIARSPGSCATGYGPPTSSPGSPAMSSRC